MPRFERILVDGMRKRGNEVVVWECPVIVGRFATQPLLRKWLGYIDQFLLFPFIVRKRLRGMSRETLFVFTDQALGPWVPLISDRPHVIHCHDFLAQRSADGDVPENPTSWTGRQYLAMIRRGYRRGRNFISVSKKTQEELHHYLDCKPVISEVVYNPLNYPFCPLPAEEAWERLRSVAELRVIVASQENDTAHRQDACATLASSTTEPVLPSNLPTTEASIRFILHVGGNQWYKNRIGLVLIYAEYCKQTASPIPLLMIGRRPPEKLVRMSTNLENGGQVIFAENLSDEQVHAAYAAASVLLFPSLDEGFGWPIAEAMACGCPVITTNRAPMTEVGGDAAVYIERRPYSEESGEWARASAEMLVETLDMPHNDRVTLSRRGSEAARQRFDSKAAVDKFENLYLKVLKLEKVKARL